MGSDAHYAITVTVHSMTWPASTATMPYGPPRPCHSESSASRPRRGNGRERTFFGDHNYKLYRDLLAENCRAARVEVSSYGDSALIRGAAAFEVTARMAVHAR